MKRNSPVFSEKFDPHKFLAIIFLLAIFLPLCFQILAGKKGVSTSENRIMKQMPAWSWNPRQIIRLPEQIQMFYNDNFGLRDILIRWDHRLIFNVFNTSPVSTVVLGQNGWLYMNEFKNVEDFLGVLPLPESSLLHLRQDLEQKKLEMGSGKIPFYLVIAPDKETIYPEYLPATIKNINTRQRFEDYYQRIETPDGIDMINILPALMQGKNNEFLYYRTDTHWNSLGSFIASQEIVDHVRLNFPDVRPLSLNDYQVTKSLTSGKDLATMMDFPEIQDTEIALTPISANPIDCKSNGSDVLICTSGHKNAPVLLLFGDSFGEFLLPILSDRFSKVILVKKANDFGPYILEYQPDAVLWEIVERMYFIIEEKPPLWDGWMQKLFGF
jgi:hypothetical protein